MERGRIRRYHISDGYGYVIRKDGVQIAFRLDAYRRPIRLGSEMVFDTHFSTPEQTPDSGDEIVFNFATNRGTKYVTAWCYASQVDEFKEAG